MSDQRVCQVELTVQEARKVAAALMLSELVQMTTDPEKDQDYTPDPLRTRFENAAAIGELELELQLRQLPETER